MKCYYCKYDSYKDFFLLTFRLKDQNVKVCEDCYFKYETELSDKFKREVNNEL